MAGRETDGFRTGRPYVVVSCGHPRGAGRSRSLRVVRGSRRTERRSRPPVSCRRPPSRCSAAIDPGETDDSGPGARRSRRGGSPAWVSTRRPRATGSTTTAPTGCWPATRDGRRLAVLEDQGIHAEVTYPGPVLVGGIAAAMFAGANRSERTRARVAGAARLQPLARRLLLGRAGPPRRMHPDRPPRHGSGHRGDRVGPRRAGLFGGVMLPAMSITSGLRGLRRRLLRAVLERVRGQLDGRQPAHRRIGCADRCEAAVRHEARWLRSGCTRSSSSRGDRCGSWFRWRLRPSSAT